ARDGGAWWLGTGRAGRVRARIEAPGGAALRVRAAGQEFLFPLTPLLDGPQRTPPGTGLDLEVERLAWDSLEVRLPEGDGTIAPGAMVPVQIGLNIQAPEPGEVAVRLSADLRPIGGDEPLWQQPEGRLVVAANAPQPAGMVLEVPAPRVEGTYVLEVRAAWEAAAAEGSRVSRLIRRRRGPLTGSASRRVTLTVVGPVLPPLPPGPGPAEVVVEAIDLSRARSHRPWAGGRLPTLSPRAPVPIPEAALAFGQRGDRLRSLIGNRGAEPATLGPADGSGLAWSAFGLKVPHPGRPHRLTVAVAAGDPAQLGVALVAPGGPAGRPRVLLDAGGSGPIVAEGGLPARLSFLIWPDSVEPVLIVYHRGASGPLRLAGLELAELTGDLPPAPRAVAPPAAPRHLALDLTGPHALDRFGGGGPGELIDALALGRHLAAYVAHVGASAVVLPGDWEADRLRRRALDGQAGEDATGPDRLDLVLRLLGQRGILVLLETRFDGPLPGLPTPEAPEALARGLVRVDRRGQSDGPAYQPLRPEVRDAMRRRVAAAIAPRQAHPNLVGLLIRLGPGGTLPGGPEVGLDDGTYERFVHAMFAAAAARNVPGLDLADPARFAARGTFVLGAGQRPWLSWRAQEVGKLYAELAQAARRAAPGAILAVATPGLDGGPAGAEARRADAAGLPPDRAWRAVGLDLRVWPAAEGLVVLRGVGASAGGLGRDLAVSPELDAQVAAQPRRGLLLGIEEADEAGALDDGRWPAAPQLGLPLAERPPRLGATPLADGPPGDEPLGHGLAVLDARWVVVALAAITGQEDRLRRFGRVLRSLPAPEAATPPLPRSPNGIASRWWTVGGRTYLALANDTPYKVLLETVLPAPPAAPVDDLGRGQRLKPAAAPHGGKQLVLELPPYGIAALRIGHPEVRPGPVTLHAQEGRDTQYRKLLALHDRLAQLGAAGPPNPGFEPPRPTPAEIRLTRTPAAIPGGWLAVGDPANTAEIDSERPHSGQGSLRLTARALPAAVVGEPFTPPGGSALMLRAWLRADRPEARVRVGIEGESNGHHLGRQAELIASTDWAQVAIPLTDLPPTGLDRARLRFELLAPGRLWIDDLSLAGPAPGEPERRARRDLVAALQAYTEGRYADFARLAGSHHAHRLDPAEAAAGAEPIRTGRASDLPPGRRLR
ncbi:MAG: hypothetical protein IRY99_15100, partial [Isosphaeraceae bacterium]|nr:hypothetical protein [Isosphaeraceae bacterium]